MSSFKLTLPILTCEIDFKASLGGEDMILHILQLEDNKSVKLWELTEDYAVAQFFDGLEKSKKATCKIQETQNKGKFIKVKGHRYYLDMFTKIEI